MKKMYKFLTLLSCVFIGITQSSLAQAPSWYVSLPTFSYTGSVQTFTVPYGIDTIYVDMKGALGGNNSAPLTHPDRPGYGGCLRAYYAVTPGQVLYAYVGGKGTDGVTGAVSPGGFNGGGAGQYITLSFAGGGGGGATDLRLGGTALANRILVAAGGGGAGLSSCTSPGHYERGGDGGSFTGENGMASCSALGTPVGGGGGTPTSPGAGGSCSSCGGLGGSAGAAGGGNGGNAGLGSPGGGGGGGYYGGGGGQYTGGGGGSNYANGSAISVVSTRGCNSTTNGTISIWADCNRASVVTASATTICAGQTLTVSDPVPGGTWSSSNTGVATVDPITGVVTGVYPGTTGGATVTITYNVGPCTANSSTITVNPVPAVITGSTSVCFGLTAPLSDSIAGGTWALSGAGSVDMSTGDFSGTVVGTGTVTYTLPTGCLRTGTVVVNPLPAPITGTPEVCVGLTTPLSDITSAGTWSSSNTTISTVDASGVVTGVVAGVDSIIYTITATGCIATASFTVDPLPDPISGPNAVCKNSNILLSTTSFSGTWTSSNTLAATVNPGTGQVTGVNAGSTTITYTLPTGCITTYAVTVNPLPAIITGTPVVCVGFTTTLSDATAGGTWSTSNTFIATANSTTGDITGVSGGIIDVYYTITATGCASSVTFTVNPLPLPIIGSSTVCAGDVTTLSNINTGGTWTSSNTSVAIINPSTGDVSGVPMAFGTSTITYTLPTGCYITAPITVFRNFPIYGTKVACYTASMSLTDSTDGGIGLWSGSGSIIVAGAGSTATITGTSAGTGTVTYTSALGCVATTTVTFTPLDPITGLNTVCQGSTITLSNPNIGGTWTSGATTIATIGSSSGIVTGVAGGTTTITYTLGTGCASYFSITVNPLPAPITGAHQVCLGFSTPLSDATGGGAWSTSSGGVVASITSLGLVTGNSVGTDDISYTLLTGCYVTYTFTVNPLPGPITGTTAICQGFTSTLSGALSGGTWTSTATSVATIGSSSGLMTAGSAGTTTISYIMPTGCYATTVATVNPTPKPITGADTICGLSTALYSDLDPAGTWSVYSTATGTISIGGTFTADSVGGIDSIIYTLPTGCRISKPMFVRTLGPIRGLTTAICVGSTLALSDYAAGGTWSALPTAVGTIDPVTGVLTGLSTGVVTVKDTFSTGCFVTTAITVNPVPVAITGATFTVCAGANITLSDGTLFGTWSSSNTSIASINSGTGVLTGANPGGTATVTYTLGTGCYATATVTVNPIDSLWGYPWRVCLGSTVTLSSGISTSGGTWTSSNTTIAIVNSTGDVTGMSGGSCSITYTTPAGCFARHTFTVYAVPNITGTTKVCEGFTTTLSNSISGGTWSSSNTNATVSGSGVVTGVSYPGAFITYTAPPIGCFNVVFVTVDSVPLPISGTTEICAFTTTTLSDPDLGGTWTSSTTTIATVGSSTGLVTGVLGGTSTITYKFTVTGCYTTTVMTIDSNSAITGSTSTCNGLTLTLSNVVSGGTWSSSNSSVASVGAGVGNTTVVTGNGTGTATITYTTAKGCESITTVTILPLPSTITGTLTVCQGSTTALSNTTGSGTWASSNTSIAVVNSSGVVTGQGGGTATITYTVGSGCYATAVVTVDPITPILGAPFRVCDGSTITLTDATAGGTWSASNTNISITVVPPNDAIISTNVSAGTTTITYTMGTGCTATQIVTVNPLPNSITTASTGVVCSGSQISLTDASGGGAWTSQSTSIAIVNGTGVVTGQGSGGITNITYTLPTTCYAVFTVTVNPLPGPILGPNGVCLGGSVTLSDATLGGDWSSTATSIATIGSGTGVVVSVALGTTTISYTDPSTGCAATKTFSVNPFPNAITGPNQVCVASSIALSNATGGGAWTSLNTSVATVNVGGNVTGVGGGTASIDYTLPTGCNALYTVTVLALPPAVITPLGDTNICPGGFVALTAPTGTLLSYQWFVAGGPTLIPGATNATYIATPSVNTSYEVRVKAGTTGCQAMSPAMLVSIIPTSASLSSSPSSGVVCSGTALTLTASGTAPTGYQWESSGVPISGATAVTYSPTVSGTYDVVITNATGCSAKSAAMTVTINPLPAGTIKLIGPASVCVGDSVHLATDTATGNTYQWFRVGGGPVSGATNADFYAKATGSYSVTVTNKYGCSKSSGSIAVVINPLPTGTDLLESGSLVFCYGGLGVTLSAISGVGGTATYQWYKNGSPLLGSTASNLLVAVSGRFKALITDPATGCSAFTPEDTTVLITQPIISPVTSASFCWGGSALLKATIVSGVTPTYQWSVGGSPITGATNNTYSATKTGTYSCVVSVPSCSALSTTLSVWENPLPNPVVTYSSSKLHVQTYYVTYQWYKNLASIPGATTAELVPSGNGNYKVGVTDTNGCQSISDVYVLTGWVDPGHTGGVYVPTVAKGEVRIYPNPAQNVVHVEAGEPVRVIISAIDGRNLIEQPNATDINISKLADGIYNIRLYNSAGEMVKTEKLVKSSN